VPYTLSHPAAVLALGRTWFPMAAMVFGSVVPDFPMFGLTPWSYDFAHSWTGVMTADVVAGVVLTVLWVLLVRDAMAAAAPANLRRRLRPAAAYAARDWWLVVPSAAIGAVTHLAWDDVTHGGRWGARHLAWLNQDHLGIEGIHWAQGGSSVVGGTVVVVYVVRRLMNAGPGASTALAVSSRPVARWGIATALVVAVAAAAAGGYSDRYDTIHGMAYVATIYSMPVLVFGLTVASLAWRVAASRPAGVDSSARLRRRPR
jgi:hypothetical protein